jgi:hypothetical protein
MVPTWNSIYSDNPKPLKIKSPRSTWMGTLITLRRPDFSLVLNNLFNSVVVSCIFISKPYFSLVLDPVRFKIWVSNFDRVIGSFRSKTILKNKNEVVLVKQKSTDCNRVLSGQPTRSHQVFSSLVFSSTRPGSSPG